MAGRCVAPTRVRRPTRRSPAEFRRGGRRPRAGPNAVVKVRRLRAQHVPAACMTNGARAARLVASRSSEGYRRERRRLRTDSPRPAHRSLSRFDSNDPIRFNQQLRHVPAIVEHLIDIAIMVTNSDAEFDVIVPWSAHRSTARHPTGRGPRFRRRVVDERREEDFLIGQARGDGTAAVGVAIRRSTGRFSRTRRTRGCA